MQGPSVYVLEALAADAAERGESDRWAECIWVASQRNWNRSEMQLAFDEFKDRFHNSPDQLSQDQRCNKKRSRLNAYFKQVFGHNNGIWDY